MGVSLDGIRKTHDACRVDANGRGTFHQVMDTISLFRKYQVDFNILTVVNRETSRNIRRIYEFYQKTDFFISSISHACPLLRRSGCRTLFLERGSLRQLFKSAVRPVV